jgi:uncharacterized protein YjiS (DUF1127 family)
MITTSRSPADPSDRFAGSVALAAAAYGGTAGWDLVGPRAEGGPSSTARRAAVRMVEAVMAWHHRARQRRVLMELSDHLLRDIGISRADAFAEATRPFWRV